MGIGQIPDDDDPVTDTGKRLRALADRLYGGNKSDLARSLGMKPTSFVKYTKGRRRPGAIILAKLSRMGVNINWLLTGVGPMLVSGPPPDRQHGRDPDSGTEYRPDKSDDKIDRSEEQFYRIPLLAIREDPDRGVQLVETGMEEWIPEGFIRKEYGVAPELLRDFRVTGDSMAETLRPGDRVRAVLWEDQVLTDGALYLVRTADTFLIRRVRRREEEVVLVADHPDVADRAVPQEEWESEFTLVARILEVVRSL